MEGPRERPFFCQSRNISRSPRFHPGVVMEERLMRRIVAGVVVVALAACSGGGGGGGETVLFEDDFSSGNLSQWVVSSSPGGSPTVDLAYGNAVPSVHFAKAANAAGGGGSITANPTFAPPAGVTLTFQASTLVTTADGQTTVLMKTSNGSNTCQAGVQLQPTKVIYELTNGLSKPLYIQTIGADTGWHTYALVIGSNGAMTWYRDGAAQLASPAYVGCESNTNILSLQIAGGGTTGETNSNVDNVLVTRD